MKEDIFYPSKDGITTIHACIWRPEGQVNGVVQILHGMTEYIGRYAPLAEYLVSNGYLVCGEDHLGHGQSVVSEDKLGYFSDERSTDIVIADIRALTLTVKQQAGDVPFFMLGHSMGSFFCRKYISLYGNDLSGAVVMGTGFMGNALLNFGKLAIRLNALFKGWDNRSNLIRSLAFGGYNKKFKPSPTGYEWLSVDVDNLISYMADKLCTFRFTNNGYYILFSIIKEACAKKTISAVPKTLPVFFVAGSDDPVGNYGKAVLKTYRKFKKAGVKNASVKIYDGVRHEILNDVTRDEVRADLLNFFNSHLGESND